MHANASEPVGLGALVMGLGSMGPIEWAVALFEAYLVFGLLFAVAFVVWGAARIDAVAQDGTRGFRLLLVPGAVLLWPVLLVKWSGARKAAAGHGGREGGSS